MSDFFDANLIPRASRSPPQSPGYLTLDQHAHRFSRDTLGSAFSWSLAIPMEVRDWQFPKACPKCHATSGFPSYVTTDEPMTADILCHSCHHVWVISATRSVISVDRKKDRRRTTEQGRHARGRLEATGSRPNPTGCNGRLILPSRVVMRDLDQATRRRASILPSHCANRFQLALFWSTILRS